MLKPEWKRMHIHIHTRLFVNSNRKFLERTTNARGVHEYEYGWNAKKHTAVILIEFFLIVLYTFMYPVLYDYCMCHSSKIKMKYTKKPKHLGQNTHARNITWTSTKKRASNSIGKVVFTQKKNGIDTNNPPNDSIDRKMSLSLLIFLSAHYFIFIFNQ